MNILRKSSKYRSTDRNSDLMEAKDGLPQMNLLRKGPQIFWLTNRGSDLGKTVKISQMNVLRKGPRYRSTDRDYDSVGAKDGLPQMNLLRQGPKLLINKARFWFREGQKRATPHERIKKRSKI
jgi:hypothetical protein